MKLNLLFLSAAALVNAATGTVYDTAVDLGDAGDYVILAKSGISTVPDSVVKGDIAVSPGSATTITGFNPLTLDDSGEFSTASQVVPSYDDDDKMVHPGNVYAADYNEGVPTTEKMLSDAVGDMVTAYDKVAGLANNDADRINLGSGSGEIGGKVLTAGIYTFDRAITITGTTPVEFDGENDPNAVFVLQTSKNIKQAANTLVTLSRGAKAENIFWQVAENVEVGADAHMKGVILAAEEVTFITGSSLVGRILTQKACVLQKAKITEAVITEA
jgi:hypothetical protein